MSDAQVEKRPRGRPKKAEEDKIQDLNAYKREWNKAHKNDPELIEKRKLQHHIANRRRMDLSYGNLINRQTLYRCHQVLCFAVCITSCQAIKSYTTV
jgi:hypothetical protein